MRRGFGQTRWTLVLRAGDTASSESQRALEELCRAYRQPLRDFAGCLERDPQRADDLVQDFFTRLVEKNVVAKADPARGRFRSFLRAGLYTHMKGDAKQRGRTEEEGQPRRRRAERSFRGKSTRTVGQAAHQPRSSFAFGGGQFSTVFDSLALSRARTFDERANQARIQSTYALEPSMEPPVMSAARSMLHHIRLQRLAFAAFGWMLAVLTCSCSNQGPDSGNALSLADRIEIFEDPSATMSLDQVIASENAGAFRRRPGPLNFGVAKSAFWIRFDLSPRDFVRDSPRWVVSLAPQFVGITAYATNDRFPWREIAVTDLAQRQTAPLAFDVEGDREGATHLLFRAYATETLFFIPRLQTGTEYVEEHAANTLGRGAYYGVLIGAIVYNFFLALWLRDRAYVLYVLFEAAYCAGMACLDRSLAAVFPRSLWALQHALTERIFCVTCVLAVLFARDFLDQRSDRRVGMWATATAVMGIALTVFPQSVGPHFVHSAPYVFIIYVCLLILSMTLLSLRRGNANAFLFLVGFGTVLLASTFGPLTYLGVLIPKYSIIGSLQLSSAIEAMLFAIALARRVNLLKRAEEIARTELADARLRLSQTLQRQVTSLNTLVGGVAHEIGNPLNFAAGGAKDVVRRIHQADEIASEIAVQANPTAASSLRNVLQSAGRSAALAARGTERIESIVKNLRAYVGAGVEQAEPTDLDGCIRSTVALLDAYLLERHVEVRLELGIGIPARCSASEINQIITNLLLNAAQAMPDGGLVVIRSEETTDHLRVVITDNGLGVPPTIRHSIFDPFFTTRAPNEGTGLGLAVSAEIARRHGGKLDLLPAHERASGASFALTLPRVDG